MALFGTLNVGITGLLSQSLKIDSISDNISNISTVGYKAIREDFRALVDNHSSLGSYASQGVFAKGRQLNTTQGELASSDVSTDIAVSGNGFFVVSPSVDSSTILYTRAGSFSPDSVGNLMNGAGYYLRAWALDSTGALSGGETLVPVNVEIYSSEPVATSNFSLRANLNSSQPVYDQNVNQNVPAVGTLNFAANPSPGDTIIVGGATWSFVASGATGNQTNIGASLTATLSQLATDLNAVIDPPVGMASFAATATSLNATYDSNGNSGTTYNLASSNANVTSPATDVATMTFGANPSPGDTISIGGTTWTFVASGATGNQTNIATSVALTLDQLATDLNASTDPNISLASYTNVARVLTIDLDTRNAAFPLAANMADRPLISSMLSLPPVPYDATLATNNMAGGLVTPHFTRVAEFVDNSGIEHSVRIGFLKTSNNTWQAEIYGSATDITNGRTDGQVASGIITFNGDGTLASVTGTIAGAVSFPWASVGTTPTGSTIATTANSVTFDWGTAGPIFGTPGATVIGLADGLAQMSKDYTIVEELQDGSVASTLKSVEISLDGVVTANYSNGINRPLYQIPLGMFQNADALAAISGNVYSVTSAAGFVGHEAARGEGAGAIRSKALEGSNIDLANELTNIIIAQRAYQSNTKLIETTDNMLDVATRMLG